MTGMNTLPAEILRAIVSDQCIQLPDLFNCSLVCRSLGEAATAALYRYVDLSTNGCYYDDKNEESRRRQRGLLRSISKNPKLGSFVKVFKDQRPRISGQLQDAASSDEKLSTKAAKNMKLLSKASLTANALAGHIIANLQSYTKLISLEVYALDPRDLIWNMAPTHLTSLDWKGLPGRFDTNRKPWDAIQFLLNVVEATCPALESLDVSNSRSCVRRPPPDFPTISRESIQQYYKQQASTTLTLTRLRHFGLGSCFNETDVDNGILDFVRKHQQSLKSLSIPACSRFWNRGNLEFVLTVCDLLSGLKLLKLEESGAHRTGEIMTSFDFLRALMTNLASPKHSVESFSLANIGCYFSPAIAPLFHPLTNLKFLLLGDRDNKDGPYYRDGRFDFLSYRTGLIAFIKSLPPSLEELYLEINGEGMFVDDDKDFNAMCDLGREIFTTLRHLHTCDIHAWISDIDGGLGQIPEKGVFYRRLPCQSLKEFKSPSKVPDSKTRAIWTSRMDSLYQEDDVAVTVDFEVVELEDGKGDFEGKDATEPWWDGIEFDEPGTSDRENPSAHTGYSWLVDVDKAAEYPMFRKRFY